MAAELPGNYCRDLVAWCLVAVFIGAIGATGVFLRAVSKSSLENPGGTHNTQNTDAEIGEDQVEFEAKIETKGEK